MHLSRQAFNIRPVCALRTLTGAYTQAHIRLEESGHVFTYCGFKKLYKVIHEYLLYWGTLFRALGGSPPSRDPGQLQQALPSGACTGWGDGGYTGLPQASCRHREGLVS